MKSVRVTLHAAAMLLLSLLCAPASWAAGKPAISSDFIVFGYIQSENILPNVRWNALTHVTGLFAGITSTGGVGSISGRSSILKAGGAAQAAGVKYIMVAQSFDDNAGGVIETVMTDYSASGPKQTLINNIVNQVTGDSYCAGVNFDLEFSWGTSVRDGIADFLTKLRAAMPAQYEISVYVNAIYSSSQWNAPNLAANCNYVLFSGYDWATGSTPHAITDHNNNTTQINNWINAGIPADKFIYTISSYGRRWSGTSTYDVAGSSPSSRGFTDALYDTTLRASNGGPYVLNYKTGDEAGWYTYNDGTQRTVTWDNEASLEYKIRNTLALATGTNAGKRLRGVGFWSLMWMADMNREAGGTSNISFDPIAGLSGTSSSSNNYAYTRTYPHIYQLTQEILSPPGVKNYVFNKFEGLDYRWDAFSGTGSTPSPDNVNFSTASTRTIVSSPAGAGAPPDSTNAMRLGFTWTDASLAGKCFFRHELLNSEIDNSVVDTNSANAKFSANTKLNAYVNCSAAFTGLSVRMVVFDKNRQLEASPAIPLNASGWQLISWDLPNATPTGLSTAEPAFLSGNGVLDTGTFGARDLGFVGFLLEHTAGGTATGNVYFDELSYQPSTPGNNQYLINEYHYITASREFVEIKGPVGAFPANLALVFYSSTTGNPSTTVSLSGKSIPASGYFVVGDPGISNVNYTPTGWTTAANNIPNTAPTGMQLIDAVTGCVYDSVVYGAMGGLGDLVRRQAQGVTNEGYGWIAEGAAGTNGSALSYTFGRYPDGTDSNINESDFSFMGSTPGAANNNGSVLGQTYDFTALPSALYQTYQLPRSVSPATNGLPALNGNALRVVNLASSGTIAFLSDPSLGTSSFSVTGNVYIPAAGAPAQAIGLGICGTQGSKFFETNAPAAGYENGYWLVYENGTVNLADDQPNHNQQFQFIHASNDNVDASRSKPLGTNKSLATLGATAGQWTTFRLTLDLANPTPSNRLIAQINGNDVYRGDIPNGGPTHGNFQIGFRHNGAALITDNTEGAWIDNLAFSSLTGVADWSIY
jgi:hypothetical protein